MIILALRLKQLREKNNCTQDEVANALNIDRSTVAYWESGRKDPGYVNLVKLGHFFNVSPAYFLDERMSPTPYESLIKLPIEVFETLGNKPHLIEIIRRLNGLEQEQFEKVEKYLSRMETIDK